LGSSYLDGTDVIDRAEVLFQISHVLRTRCRGYLKIRERVDDPIPDIVARDILEHLERRGYRIAARAEGVIGIRHVRPTTRARFLDNALSQWQSHRRGAESSPRGSVIQGSL
jgi:hypothetical protein